MGRSLSRQTGYVFKNGAVCDRFASMFADPDDTRRLGPAVVGRELVLDEQGAGDRGRDIIERRDDAVAEVLQLSTAMLLRRAAPPTVEPASRKALTLAATIFLMVEPLDHYSVM